jgi:hypothetical protein
MQVLCALLLWPTRSSPRVPGVAPQSSGRMAVARAASLTTFVAAAYAQGPVTTGLGYDGGVCYTPQGADVRYSFCTLHP